MSGTFTTTFSYNGDGQRMAKAENGVTTTYVVAVLGLSQVLVETTGGESIRYVYGHDLLAEYDGTSWAYHLNDGLGSVRQLADGNGNVQVAQGYTPFGQPLWSEGNGSTGYGFTGERWEAYAQLLFLRARYYEPGTGRFINRDPWSGSVQRPQSFQSWSYVQNNPIKYTDPTGAQPQQLPIDDWQDKPVEWLRDKADSCYRSGDLKCVWRCYWAVATGGGMLGYDYASAHLYTFLYKWGDLEYSPSKSSWVSSSPSVQKEIPRLKGYLLGVIQTKARRGQMNGHAWTQPLNVAIDIQEKDLYYAMFNFWLWEEADYEVEHCGGCEYEVTVESKYRFHDDYNWHPGLDAGGAVVGVQGFQDEWAAALHDAGLAKEFTIDGYWYDRPKVKVYTFPSDWLVSGTPSFPTSVGSGKR